MNNVASLSRSAAEALVDREERRTGSRMMAYETVAQTVGTSSEWLRKFIQRHEGKEPKLTVGFKLLAFYSQICVRVEHVRDEEIELKREIDAAIQSISGVAKGTPRTSGSTVETAETAEGE